MSRYDGPTEPPGFWDEYDPDVEAERLCEECGQWDEHHEWCPVGYLLATGDEAGATRMRLELELEMAS